jgi:predicted DNA-binding transcriptional regulator AlpA
MTTPSAIQLAPLLTAERTAKLLGVSTSWLAKKRLTGDGPRYVKIGRVVRYPESAVHDYIRSNTRHSTSEDKARDALLRVERKNSVDYQGGDGKKFNCDTSTSTYKNDHE